MSINSEALVNNRYNPNKTSKYSTVTNCVFEMCEWLNESNVVTGKRFGHCPPQQLDLGSINN